MWMPRIRVIFNNSNEFKNVEYNVWYDITNFNGRTLKYRILKNGYIDFILLLYDSKEEALKEAKVLYYNVLLNGYKDFFDFKMGDMEYITSFFHSEDGIPFEEWREQEEWFFVTKKRRKNHTGLIIFEADSLDDYINTYELKGELEVHLSAECERLPKIFERLKNIDYDVSYDKNNQRIFRLFHIVESVSEEAIKILLLTRILELMCEKEKKDDKTISLLDSLIDIVNESDSMYKDDIRNGLSFFKNKSDRQQIRELLKKYDLNSDENVKLAMKCYSIRSKIIHGEEYDEQYIYSYDLQHLTISIFEKWNKDKNRI